jgi:hypothetical protein
MDLNEGCFGPCCVLCTGIHNQHVYNYPVNFQNKISVADPGCFIPDPDPQH